MELEKNTSEEDIMGMKPNTYCMLIHLAQLLHFTGAGGFVVPIVLWAIAKDKNPEVDRHGKIVLNWLISSLIYGAVCGLFCLVLIGIPFLLVLFVLTIVFPIIGAVKANDGTAWKYPLSIPIFK